jgi:hypothetical protein
MVLFQELGEMSAVAELYVIIAGSTNTYRLDTMLCLVRSILHESSQSIACVTEHLLFLCD